MASGDSRMLTDCSRLGLRQPPPLQSLRRHAGEIRFDVEDGRAVQHVDAAHMEAWPIPTEQLDHGKADGVWSSRRACGNTPWGRVSVGGVARRS